MIFNDVGGQDDFNPHKVPWHVYFCLVQSSNSLFVQACVVDIFANENLIPIGILKHKRRHKSLFKHGLSIITAVLMNPFNFNDFDDFKLLSRT